MTVLRSERCVYRPLVAEDVTERYVGWLNDPEINRFLETRLYEPTMNDCIDYVVEKYRDPNTHLFGIYPHHSIGGVTCVRHIGNIQIRQPLPWRPVGEISAFIGQKEYWGKGYATEAIGRIIRFGFDECGLHKIWAGFYKDHWASIRAFTKAGMRFEATLRENVNASLTADHEPVMVDQHIYSILRREWDES